MPSPFEEFLSALNQPRTPRISHLKYCQLLQLTLLDELLREAAKRRNLSGLHLPDAVTSNTQQARNLQLLQQAQTGGLANAGQRTAVRQTQAAVIKQALETRTADIEAQQKTNKFQQAANKRKLAGVQADAVRKARTKTATSGSAGTSNQKPTDKIASKVKAGAKGFKALGKGARFWYLWCSCFCRIFWAKPYFIRW